MLTCFRQTCPVNLREKRAGQRGCGAHIVLEVVWVLAWPPHMVHVDDGLDVGVLYILLRVAGSIGCQRTTRRPAQVP